MEIIALIYKVCIITTKLLSAWGRYFFFLQKVKKSCTEKRFKKQKPLAITGVRNLKKETRLKKS